MNSYELCSSSLPHLIRALSNFQDSVQDGKIWQRHYCKKDNQYNKNPYAKADMIVRNIVKNAEAFIAEWLRYMKENYGAKGAILAQIEQLRRIELDSSAATSSGSENSPQKEGDMKHTLDLSSRDPNQDDGHKKLSYEYDSSPGPEAPDAVSDEEWENSKCSFDEYPVVSEVYDNPLQGIREKIRRTNAYITSRRIAQLLHVCSFLKHKHNREAILGYYMAPEQVTDLRDIHIDRVLQLGELVCGHDSEIPHSLAIDRSMKHICGYLSESNELAFSCATYLGICDIVHRVSNCPLLMFLGMDGEQEECEGLWDTCSTGEEGEDPCKYEEDEGNETENNSEIEVESQHK